MAQDYGTVYGDFQDMAVGMGALAPGLQSQMSVFNEVLTFQSIAADQAGSVQSVFTENMVTHFRHAGYNLLVFEGNEHEGHVHLLKGNDFMGKVPLDVSRWNTGDPDYKVKSIPKGDLRKLRGFLKAKQKAEKQNIEGGSDETQRKEIAGQTEQATGSPIQTMDSQERV
jgi:hypothetical protein